MSEAVKPLKRFWSLVEDAPVLDLKDSNASIGEWRGVKALKFVKAGTAAFINEPFHLQAFRLQAYVAIPEPVGFIGLIFGARDDSNYELIYLSPGDSSDNGEIQYDPVMNGSTTWQIYNGPRYLAYTPYQVGEWVKLTIDVGQQSAKVYIGEDTETPRLTISKLQHGEVYGKIGVWGYLPGYVRDLTIEEISSDSQPIETVSKKGYINEWRVSEPYHSNSQPEEWKWMEAVTEENGTLNINQLYSSEKDKAVQIKSFLTLPEETYSIISFGYSDELRLWINGEEVYHGVWMWDPPQNDGRILPNHHMVPVVWKAGLNTIRAELISKETVFGWGGALKPGI
ncbi:hypothetical protein [Paenibacillus sp. NPDC058071]|uniref:hypothetical protein n=1 Tax=Paenibacillus sp. NPDC058071 TaxID=3346326 RepID=UPI0036DD30F3